MLKVFLYGIYNQSISFSFEFYIIKCCNKVTNSLILFLINNTIVIGIKTTQDVDFIQCLNSIENLTLPKQAHTISPKE